MSSIAILCTINPTGGPFASFLRRTGLSTASGKHSITWYAVTDTGFKTPEGFHFLGCLKPGESSPYNHAKLVQKGIRKLKKMNPDYVVICDVDIAFLAKNWDVRLLNELKSWDVVGVNVGSSRAPKRYMSFPILTFMAFKGNLLHELDWDLCPQKRGKGETGSHALYRATKEDARICGVSEGATLKKDAGWKIPYLFHAKGYTKSLILDEALVFSEKSKLSFVKRQDKGRFRILCGKYPHQMGEYLLPNGDPFCTHLYISRRELFGSEKTKIWRRRTVAYLTFLGVKMI